VSSTTNKGQDTEMHCGTARVRFNTRLEIGRRIVDKGVSGVKDSPPELTGYDGGS